VNPDPANMRWLTETTQVHQRIRVSNKTNCLIGLARRLVPGVLSLSSGENGLSEQRPRRRSRPERSRRLVAIPALVCSPPLSYKNLSYKLYKISRRRVGKGGT